MRLPNGDQAIVAIEKLRDYCLSRTHPQGRHKARVFSAVLGLESEHAEEFRSRLLEAAEQDDAAAVGRDQYGSRYRVDFTWVRGAAAARVRSLWIVRTAESQPRFLTCYILR